MVISKYTIGQIGLFILGTAAYSLVLPYLEFPLPEGKYWFGYGLLLIAPLVISFQWGGWRKLFSQSGLFWCFLAYMVAWISSRTFSIFDSKYLGHVPFLYLCIAGLAQMMQVKLIRNMSGLITIYCAALIIVHSTTRPTLSSIEILIYNIMYVIPLLFPIVAKKKEAPDATQAEDSSYHYREAA